MERLFVISVEKPEVSITFDWFKTEIVRNEGKRRSFFVGFVHR